MLYGEGVNRRISNTEYPNIDEELQERALLASFSTAKGSQPELAPTLSDPLRSATTLKEI
jgi:hypothetical protein